MKFHQENSRARLTRQQGGTLLGLIIGLIVGLAIAVAVALLITKSSTPFTNKAGNKADMPTSQLLDPNKPLYGNKDAAKDAAKELAKEANTPKAPEVVDTKPAVVEKPLSPPAAAAKPAETAATAPAAPAAKAEGGDDKYVYFLQAGAFREQADAESARAKLALLGFEARISERTSENGTLYRVRIGPFSQVETMNRMRAKLSENSVDVAVVRTAK